MQAVLRWTAEGSFLAPLVFAGLCGFRMSGGRTHVHLQASWVDRQASCPSDIWVFCFHLQTLIPSMCVLMHTHKAQMSTHVHTCTHTHEGTHTYVHMHTNTHACRPSRTAVSGSWQRLQGCVPLPPARIPHHLRAEEGLRGGAGWHFWKSGLGWVWGFGPRHQGRESGEDVGLGIWKSWTS